MGEQETERVRDKEWVSEQEAKEVNDQETERVI